MLSVFTLLFLRTIASASKTFYVSDPECVVCLETPTNTALMPCRHVATCDSCSKKLLPRLCPICRVEYTDRLVLTDKQISNLKTPDTTTSTTQAIDRSTLNIFQRHCTPERATLMMYYWFRSYVFLLVAMPTVFITNNFQAPLRVQTLLILFLEKFTRLFIIANPIEVTRLAFVSYDVRLLTSEHEVGYTLICEGFSLFVNILLTCFLLAFREPVIPFVLLHVAQYVKNKYLRILPVNVSSKNKKLMIKIFGSKLVNKRHTINPPKAVLMKETAEKETKEKKSKKKKKF